MKKTLLASLLMSAFTLPAAALEAPAPQPSPAISAKRLETIQQSLNHLMPGYSRTYTENKTCSTQALQETMQFAENAVFNPFIPHCNGLHALAGLAIMGANMPGAIAAVNTALLSGCGNPYVVSAIYFEIYDECVRKSNP